jgi:hypothetical protein
MLGVCETMPEGMTHPMIFALPESPSFPCKHIRRLLTLLFIVRVYCVLVHHLRRTTAARSPLLHTNQRRYELASLFLSITALMPLFSIWHNFYDMGVITTYYDFTMLLSLLVVSKLAIIVKLEFTHSHVCVNPRIIS